MPDESDYDKMIDDTVKEAIDRSSMRRDMEPPLFKPKYPDIHVQLTGTDGNAFAILGRCLAAMTEAAIPENKRDQFTREATGGSYESLLRVCVEWFDVS